MWIALLGMFVAAAVVAVVVVRTWGAIKIRQLELSAQIAQQELNQRFMAGELTPPSGASLAEIEGVVKKHVDSAVFDLRYGDQWVMELGSKWAKPLSAKR